MILIFFLKRVRTSEIIRKPQQVLPNYFFFTGHSLLSKTLPEFAQQVVINLECCNFELTKLSYLQILWTIFCLYIAKKVVLFPEIDRMKNFLLHARPHKSNVYENMYFFCFKKISTGKVIRTNLATFFRSKNKR